MRDVEIDQKAKTNFTQSQIVGLPYVTVKSSLHSPEIEYLLPEINGIITDANESSFIDGIRRLVVNPELRLKIGNSAKSYALNNLKIEHQISGFDNAISYIKKLHS